MIPQQLNSTHFQLICYVITPPISSPISSPHYICHPATHPFHVLMDWFCDGCSDLNNGSQQICNLFSYWLLCFIQCLICCSFGEKHSWPLCMNMITLFTPVLFLTGRVESEAPGCTQIGSGILFCPRP